MTESIVFPDYDAAAQADSERVRQLGLSGDHLRVVAQAYQRHLKDLCKKASEMRRMPGSPNRVEAQAVQGDDVRRAISVSFGYGPPRLITFGKLWVEKTDEVATVKWEFQNNERYEVGEQVIDLS